MADPSAPTSTVPADEHASSARVTVVQDSVVDQSTKALWIHRDLVQVKEPWADEAHISPMRADEALGDVPSWASYVTRYANLDADPFIRWNAQGLLATLDYLSPDGGPGRRQWHARYKFEPSKAFMDWLRFANNAKRAQPEVIEFLEAHQTDVVEPTPGDLLLMVRQMRANVRKNWEYDDDPETGATRLVFRAETGVSARGGTINVPHELKISIPVLKGHVRPADVADQPPVPVPYGFTLFQRTEVDDDTAKPYFRYEIQQMDRILEDVYAMRVAEATRLLGDTYTVLRAADGS